MHSQVQQILESQPITSADYATVVVDKLLRLAAEVGASDLHWQPTAGDLKLSWRIDGVLQPAATIPEAVASNMTTRLKVLARLLTYQNNLPQEGRIVAGELPMEVRVSTFPTIFGEKVVTRLLSGSRAPLGNLDSLGLPIEATKFLRHAISQTSGALVIAGPAGSGKTTTAYACLREIVGSRGERNVASLEDPVEVVVQGVAQSQVSPAAGFDLLTGLRSLVRQDPEVIFVGEIRDAATAEVAFQAALTGQLMITTFHAADVATALSRLADMKIPPYVLRGATNCVIAQRLMRRLCQCATPGDPADETATLGLQVENVSLPTGCQLCQSTGYHGRTVIAEAMLIDQPEIAEAILAQADAKELRKTALSTGMNSLYDQALRIVQEGITSPAELCRLFGFVAAR